MPSLRDQLSSVLLTVDTGTLYQIADGPAAGEAADLVAARILDCVSAHIRRAPDPFTAFTPLVTPLGQPAPAIADPRGPQPMDALALPHDDAMDDVAALCDLAGLEYIDVDFREGQPVVIARDAEGMREYQTLPALRAAAARSRS